MEKTSYVEMGDGVGGMKEFCHSCIYTSFIDPEFLLPDVEILQKF
jgi:hypothetical protein